MSRDPAFYCDGLLLRLKRAGFLDFTMTDPENFAYHLARKAKFPLWIASTSTTGRDVEEPLEVEAQEAAGRDGAAFGEPEEPHVIPARSAVDLPRVIGRMLSRRLQIRVRAASRAHEPSAPLAIASGQDEFER